LEQTKEKAIAIAVNKKGSDRRKAMDYLEELAFLAETAGAEVTELIYQEPDRISKATLLGKGKIEEIKETIAQEGINLVVFDDDLKPMQHRNLEKAFNVKVLDRSGLILDIFATRAKTIEAKTQVELAQMQYILPRLSGMWTHLSKQFGGIGSKGPGETQIETDRRIVRTKIERLKEKLNEIEQQNEIKRKSRDSLTKFALVGYTNAGKSSLMKAVTGADVYIKDELFATLDTTVRGFTLPLGQLALLSDTVGFIRKLPSKLVASFRSTLAEAREADFLLHIVDMSHEHYREHIKVVEETLESIGITDTKTLLIFNKIDLIKDQIEFAALKEEYPNALFVSATRNINISGLLEEFQKCYDELSKELTLFLPYAESKHLSTIYKFAEVLDKKDLDEGTEFSLRIPNDKISQFENMFHSFIRK